MKRTTIILLIGLITIGFCAAQVQQIPQGEIFRQEGIASWYGPEFDGRPTASGEIFDSGRFTAAHPTLPFGTELTITNRHNNKKVTVTVNDRGPFVSARIIDLSKAAAAQLDMLVTGTAPVLVESTGRVTFPAAGKPAQVIPAAQTGSESPPPDPLWVSAAEAAEIEVTGIVPAGENPPPENFAQELVVTIEPPAPGTVQAVTVISAPAAAIPSERQVTLIPAITPAANKVYRLQVGAYRIARNAVEAFDKLKNAGLNPAYERNGELFRVVLAGVRAEDLNSITGKLKAAGFSEALIREER
ncbi:MAG: septal ring lytic transglycosylase RlpA family protein [Treponema sp.]|jgi:rare lipoprotein A|nr:septal ring lytic transglycosylase RlpA family protein [Treponema sp.]